MVDFIHREGVERRGGSGASFGRRRFRFYGLLAAMAELGGQLRQPAIASERRRVLALGFHAGAIVDSIHWEGVERRGGFGARFGWRRRFLFGDFILPIAGGDGRGVGARG
jgi:hypothetical protein